MATAKPAPLRRSQSERREQARQRILDSAEALFAKHGFHGVTLRDAARETAADPSLLHYYFTDKAGLFEAVIARRAGLVDRARASSFDRYEREHGANMTAQGIVRAYVEPVFELVASGDAGVANYAVLIAKLNATVNVEELLPGPLPFEPNVRRLVALLKRAEPACADVDLYWFYHLLSGAITLSLAQTGRIDALSEGKCSSNDFAVILDRITRVFGTGLSALRALQPNKTAAPQPKRAKRAVANKASR